MLALPSLEHVHDQYLTLCRLAGERFGNDLGGKLLFRPGLDPAGIATLIGASIAGAASLCVDADADLLREALRRGLCDFVVGHPDEALRILKNELRRGLPISVCLSADPHSCIREMVGRGLQPDLLSGNILSPGSAYAPDCAQLFAERGAVLVREGSAAPPGTSLLAWSVGPGAARLMLRVGALAAEALDGQRGDTPARRRWLDAAPRYLGRAFGSRQCLRMTGAEIALFLPRVQRETPSATVARDGAAVQTPS